RHPDRSKRNFDTLRHGKPPSTTIVPFRSKTPDQYSVSALSRIANTAAVTSYHPTKRGSLHSQVSFRSALHRKESRHARPAQSSSRPRGIPTTHLFLSVTSEHRRRPADV